MGKFTRLLIAMVLPILVGGLLLMGIRQPAAAAALTVTTLIDENDTCAIGACSLREAIAEASPGDTINFAVAGTIVITPNGTLQITQSLTIDGGNQITVSGGNSVKVIRIQQDSGLVTLQNLTISDGNSDGFGGGIENLSTLLLNRVNVIDNQTTLEGGGLFSIGTLTVTDSLIENNLGAAGGGILAIGETHIHSSTIQHNVAKYQGVPSRPVYGQGGGILNLTEVESFGFGISEITIHDSYIVSNTADKGGGVSNYGLASDRLGIATISNSTIGWNKADVGGGIENIEQITVTQSSLIYNRAETGAGMITLHNTVIFESMIAHNRIENLNGDILFNLPEGGAAITNFAILTLMRSTVSNNSAEGYDGGGILNYYWAVIEDSTISNNESSGRGGAVINYGKLDMTSTTVVENQASAAAGIAASAAITSITPTVTSLTNTIIANNALSGTTTFEDIAHVNGISDTFPSGSYNLIGTLGPGITTFTETGDIVGINDPQLGPLQDNGGATFTHKPLLGSPAVDAGGFCGPFDQRGADRPADGDGDTVVACDIGAVERPTYVQPPDPISFEVLLPMLTDDVE